MSEAIPTSHGSSCGNPVNVMCPSNIDPLAKNLLNLYPTPNVNSGGVFANNLVASRNSVDNTFQFDLRVDAKLSSKDQTFVRFSLLNEPGNRPAPFGSVLDGGNFLTYGDDGNIEDLGENLGADALHIFSDRLANDLRFGFTGGNFSYTQENANNGSLASSLGLGGVPGGTLNGGLPAVNIGGISGFGSPEFYPAEEHQNVLDISDDVQRSVNSHNLKFGLSFSASAFPHNSLLFRAASMTIQVLRPCAAIPSRTPVMALLISWPTSWAALKSRTSQPRTICVCIAQRTPKTIGKRSRS